MLISGNREANPGSHNRAYLFLLRGRRISTVSCPTRGRTIRISTWVINDPPFASEIGRPGPEPGFPQRSIQRGTRSLPTIHGWTLHLSAGARIYFRAG